MANATVQKQTLDANTTARIIWPVNSHIVGTVQADNAGRVAWNIGVLEIKRSNDGETFYSFPAPVTLTTNGMTDVLDLSGIAWLSAEMTTANGAALTLNVTGCFKS